MRAMQGVVLIRPPPHDDLGVLKVVAVILI